MYESLDSRSIKRLTSQFFMNIDFQQRKVQFRRKKKTENVFLEEIAEDVGMSCYGAAAAAGYSLHRWRPMTMCRHKQVIVAIN